MKLKKYMFLTIVLLLIALLSLAVACNKHKHSYVWQESTPPTCENDGVETGKCVCGDIDTRPIPKKGHFWGDFEVIELPTEAEVGLATTTCQNDNSHTHSISLPVLTDEAYTKTPDAKGFNVEYAILINDEVTGSHGITIKFTIFVHKHTFVYDTIKESTCMEAGLKKGVCSHELCDEVDEQPIPKLDHEWEEPEIIKYPAQNTEGKAIIKCKLDENETHVREYVLPSLSSVWKDYTNPKDESNCVYNAYVASLDENNNTLYHLSMTVYDPLEGIGTPQTFEIAFDLTSSTHLHIYGPYEVENMPTSSTSGRAVSRCQITSTHTKTMLLPRFNNTNEPEENYSYEIVDNMVYWTIQRQDTNKVTQTFSGSYELPSSIVIQIGAYNGAVGPEEYADGDTIKLKVGDYPQTINIVTLLGGANTLTMSFKCVDENGKTIEISTDFMNNSASQDLGLILDADFLKTGFSIYFKDFYPTVHYLTLDAGNGLKSTYKIEPILEAPTGSGTSVLKPQTYNTKQQAWNYVSGTPEIFKGVELILGAGADTYVDPSCDITVFDENDLDLTSTCIIKDEIFGGKKGFVFSSEYEGTYTIVLTSTRTPSHSVSFKIKVIGSPEPDYIFSENYYYTYSTNRSKYTVTFEDFVNDFENLSSVGKAILVIEGQGKKTIPFEYEYSNGVAIFTATKEAEYGLKLNKSYDLVLELEDPFTGDIEEVVLEKIFIFHNSLTGSYAFAQNSNLDSSEMKVVLTVNQSGVYKFTITGSYVCINIDDETIYDDADDFDYIVGKHGENGENEILITLHEGDVIMIFNHGKTSSNLVIEFEEELENTL